MFKIRFMCVLVFCLGTCIHLKGQQIIRNLDFEQTDFRRMPVGWIPQNKNNLYFVRLDSTVSQHGRFSILISLDSIKNKDLEINNRAGLLNTGLTKLDFAGHKKITISCYIRTKHLRQGTASLWMELKGASQILNGINSDKESPAGNSKWEKYSISLLINPNTQFIVFGCKMTGLGEAWFDDFTIMLDDTIIK